MHFFSFTLKMEADVVSLRYMGNLLSRRQANLCFHFAGSGENLPDIAKSHNNNIIIKFIHNLNLQG